MVLCKYSCRHLLRNSILRRKCWSAGEEMGLKRWTRANYGQPEYQMEEFGTVLDGKGSHWRILGVMGLINQFVGQNSFSNPVNCTLNYVYDITNILISTGTHPNTQSMTLNQSWVLTSMLQIKRLVVDGILCQKKAAASLSPDLYPMLHRVKELQFSIILKYVQIFKASQIG